MAPGPGGGDRKRGSGHPAKGASRKIGRDAKTGEFIPVKEAQRRPNTTVVETIKGKPKPKGRR